MRQTEIVTTQLMMSRKVSISAGRSKSCSEPFSQRTFLSSGSQRGGSRDPLSGFLHGSSKWKPCVLHRRHCGSHSAPVCHLALHSSHRLLQIYTFSSQYPGNNLSLTEKTSAMYRLQKNRANGGSAYITKTYFKKKAHQSIGTKIKRNDEKVLQEIIATHYSVF